MRDTGRMSLARILVCVSLAGVLVACSDEGSPLPRQTSALSAEPTERILPTTTPLPPEILNDGCPVTEPNGAVPPGEDPDFASNVLGSGEIWVGLYPAGTVVFEPGGPGGRDPVDGSLGMKFWWWRGVPGELEITGRRLDGDAPPMSASIPDGYGQTGFQASALIFPTEGCWEVTGRLEDATLTFVTRVVDNYPPFEARPPVTLEDCPVTSPNGSAPPGETPNDAHHGNGELWTVLWQDGTVIFEPEGPGTRDEDGSLRMKWPFWRAVSGELELHGLRLDGHSPAMRAVVLNGYGDTGFQATVLIFPDAGCWEVIAQIGTSVLVFVTRVESRY